ncbi:phenylalanine--tRNA ligase subunit alpha [Roseivivax sediminis]|uniref:Phenylalanine--tRNA ligase alpha subunit n=1 Tax=Roseivivax sediminis TaxID=936889 RepID=A0A1I1YEK7_9RHOB|nr:phenylalanine--tRNA ligase subunit alpha [Roseivivax sediminis]SFE18035.1 phenylalanyl-tRNA synthetase, alpha subunit [Roseivivax sediminis]
MSKLADIVTEFEASVSADMDDQALKQLRAAYLGRNGAIAAFRSTVDFASLSPEERAALGKELNEATARIEAGIAAAKDKDGPTSNAPAVDFDTTLPPMTSGIGAIHPITAAQMEIEDIFRGMGFRTYNGEEAVTEFKNFDALNIPADHPARDMQDTFWLENGMVLRTHTSSMQNEAMRDFGVPVRAIFPGRCYRNEATDATHENTFYQLEGLYIDEGVTVANLIAVMKELLDQVFGRDVKVRLRPGYFPFVEPGFELDFWTEINGKWRWLELMPCGMVHREVLKHAGVDPDRYSGFAFGLGLTRLAMLKFGVQDARLFNKGSLSFARQFTATL